MSYEDVIENYFTVFSKSGDEWSVLCPVHDDSSPSASVNVKKGLWVCYACGRGGTIASVVGDEEFTASEGELLLLQEIFENLEKDNHDKPSFFPEAWYAQFEVEHSYWQQRGFSEGSVSRYKLGFDYELNAVTYPVHDPAGRLVGVVHRFLEGPLKYKYPKGMKKSELLFGYHLIDNTNTVVVTEGALDAIACWEAGYQSVAQFGSVLSQHQARLLQMLSPDCLILAYDGDEAGKKATAHALSGLLDGIYTEVATLPDGKDPADIPRDDLTRVLDTAMPTWVELS